MVMALKKTPLYAAHRRAGAKMVEFAGWEMPVQYRGVIEEHMAVRAQAGLFDVSHMGEIEVRGAGALEFCQRLTANDVARLQVSQAQYSFLLNEQGGVVDDVIIYRVKPEAYFYLCQRFEHRQGFCLAVEPRRRRYRGGKSQRPVRPVGLAGTRWRRIFFSR